MLKEKIQNLLSSKTTNRYSPDFYRLKNVEDKRKFETIIDETPGIVVFDEIVGQVEELIKCQNPRHVFSKDELNRAALDHLNKGPFEEYGVWVYYPWSNRLVHLLDEEEFVLVRTNRNQYKITRKEQDIISKKRIGVIGLSVGQSVAVTLAQERGFGELRIADYDVLELSNYNRIRIGLHNLGLNKAISVAREIAEIDPYLKVVPFINGINEENFDDFILKDGKLDLLIDECDGLDIKVLCRHKAKANQIPVLMEASDRGTIDVERFDLEPERPILHGFIEHLDVSKIKFLKSNEEKVPFLLPIAGVETLSKRAKASLVEVGQSITTWPQLASAVTLGGGITADIARRIFLNEFHDSGRYFVDIEELVADRKNTENSGDEIVYSPDISNDEMDYLISTLDEVKGNSDYKISDDNLKDIVGAAIMAPSGGNAQPWKWKYKNNTLFLFLNLNYHTKLVDFNNSASFIALGAATENLLLKSDELNFDVHIEKFPLGNSSKLIAYYNFNKRLAGNSDLNKFGNLSKAIMQRSTNRKIVERKPIADSILSKLIECAKTIAGAELRILTEEADLIRIGEIIAKADRIRLMNKGGHTDFRAEMVWTEEEALASRKGIEIDSLDLTPSEKAGFNISREWEVINHLNKWDEGKALEKYSRKTAASASAIGLITVPAFSPEFLFDGGRALERVWLAATLEGVALQPLSISTFLFNRLNYDGRHAYSDKEITELENMRVEFEKLFSIDKKMGEVFMFRLFDGGDFEKRSLRASLEDVLSLR